MKDSPQYILDLLYSEQKPFSLNNIIHDLPMEYFRTQNNSFESLKGNIQNLLRKQLIKSTKAWVFWNTANHPEHGIAYYIPHYENTFRWKWNYLKTKTKHECRELSTKIQDIVLSVFNIQFAKTMCQCNGCQKLTINEEWLGAKMYAFRGFRIFWGKFK